MLKHSLIILDNTWDLPVVMEEDEPDYFVEFASQIFPLLEQYKSKIETIYYSSLIDTKSKRNYLKTYIKDNTQLNHMVIHCESEWDKKKFKYLGDPSLECLFDFEISIQSSNLDLLKHFTKLFSNHGGWHNLYKNETPVFYNKKSTKAIKNLFQLVPAESYLISSNHKGDYYYLLVNTEMLDVVSKIVDLRPM